MLRDLTDASPEEITAERAFVEDEGWGTRLLALQDADGFRDGSALFPPDYTHDEPRQPWTMTMHTARLRARSRRNALLRVPRVTGRLSGR